MNVYLVAAVWFLNCGLSGSLSFTPDSHGADSLYAYPGRRDTCHISHTDGGQRASELTINYN